MVVLVPRSNFSREYLPIDVSFPLKRMLSGVPCLYQPTIRPYCCGTNTRVNRTKILQPTSNVDFKIDVKEFNPADISVKVFNNTLVIEGKHEENKDGDCTSRSFKKKLTLPAGVDANNVNCELSSDGILSVTSAKPTQSRHVPVQVEQSKRRHSVTMKVENKAEVTNNIETSQQSELKTQAAETVSEDKKSAENVTVESCTETSDCNNTSCSQNERMAASHHIPRVTIRRNSAPYESLSNIFRNHLNTTDVDDKLQMNTFKENDDCYDVNIDVKNFTPDEINIKINDNNSVITVEAKHEEQNNGGHRYSQMMQRFILPSDARAEDVQSTLSTDGKLTITAPKKILKKIKAEEQTSQ